MKKTHRDIFRIATLTLVLFSAGAALAGPALQPGVFAKVGDAVITQEEYDTAFAAASRGKFFHGKPPESEIAAMQRDVGDQLVARVLLLREAKQRGLRPDESDVQKTIQGYEQRYANSEQWKRNRAQLLPGLISRLEQESLLEQLEKSVRNVPKPDLKEVKAYYAANPNKFTEPEQLRVSVILLKVDPSSPKTAWVKADEEARGLIKKLQGGADFAAMARAQSGDGSAQQGGDMGYLHSGMLPDGTEAVLAALKVGEISNPVQMLEGMGVFKLTDRKPAKLNSFETVQGRAQDLLHRDKSDQAWNKLIAELRKKTPAQIDQSRFLPLAEQSTGRTAAK
jgi:parvulin-like peptidyl-prolyl isomerase